MTAASILVSIWVFGLSGEDSISLPPSPLAASKPTAISARIEGSRPVPSTRRPLSSCPALVEFVKRHEGTKAFQAHKGFFRRGRFFPYRDPKGFPTIGYGHRIQAGEDYSRGLTEAGAEELLLADLAAAESAARALVENFDRLGPVRRMVLIDMAFNLGRRGLAGFKRMLRALDSEDYARAALEMRRSRWYRQVGRRAKTLSVWMLGTDGPTS